MVAGPDGPWPVLDGAPAVAARTTVLPVQDHDTLPALYASAAVTAVPSVDEAFGLVAVESLACGTQVLAAPAAEHEAVWQRARGRAAAGAARTPIGSTPGT